MNTLEHATAVATAIASAIATATGVDASTIDTAPIVAAIVGPEAVRTAPEPSKEGIATVVNGKVVYS
jgi:hypothetical protein